MGDHDLWGIAGASRKSGRSDCIDAKRMRYVARPQRPQHGGVRSLGGRHDVPTSRSPRRRLEIAAIDRGIHANAIWRAASFLLVGGPSRSGWLYGRLTMG